MLKKSVILAVAILMFLSSMVLASDVTQEQQEAAEKLVAIGILTGYEDGSLKLDNYITRAEFTTIAVRLILKDEDVDSYKKDTIFSDVTKAHWASGYINIAVEEGLINGYGDGTFKPENKITTSEVITILVRLLGQEDSLNKDKEWPLNYIQRAIELGIDTGDVIVPNANATRGEVALSVYKTLTAQLKKEY